MSLFTYENTLVVCKIHAFPGKTKKTIIFLISNQYWATSHSEFFVIYSVELLTNFFMKQGEGKM